VALHVLLLEEGLVVGRPPRAVLPVRPILLQLAIVGDVVWYASRSDQEHMPYVWWVGDEEGEG
jgi:hypothetical protein